MAAIDGITALLGPSEPPPTPPQAPAKPTPSPPHRGRRWLVAAAVLLLGAAAVWYNATVIRAHPVRYDGGESGVQASSVVRHDDPFAAGWYEVQYQPGGTVHIEFNIHNAGPFDVHVQRIAFPGLGTDSSVSPLYRADPLDAVGDLAGSGNLRPFQPFTLPADGWALIAWDLSMCPNSPAQQGSSVGFGHYQITYSYLGWTRTFTEPLPTPLQITDAGRCLANGMPG